MSRQWEELTDQFDALSEDRQRHYGLLVYSTMQDVTSLGSNEAETLATGVKRICTKQGHACNRIDDQTFEIVALGLQVRRA